MSDDIFQQLHTELTKQLLERVKKGEATAADLNVARQWLNDNKVAADPRRNVGLKELDETISDLPFDAEGVPTNKAH